MIESEALESIKIASSSICCAILFKLMAGSDLVSENLQNYRFQNFVRNKGSLFGHEDSLKWDQKMFYCIEGLTRNIQNTIRVNNRYTVQSDCRRCKAHRDKN